MALDIEGFSKTADDFVSQKQEENKPDPEPSFVEKTLGVVRAIGESVQEPDVEDAKDMAWRRWETRRRAGYRIVIR